MEKKENILIISDLHLGYRSKDLSILDYENETKQMDKHFKKFINYYTNLDETKSWELIINGDFIDFIQINYRLESEFSRDYKLSLDDIKYGMNNKEDHIVWKLQKVAKIHNTLFRELSKFIERGNSLILIKGNHDVEFYWPKVKRELKNILAEFVDFETEEEKLEFMSRIKIKDWIYYKENLLYMEHGNQYDDYTSFNHFVAPLSVTNHKKIEMPFSHVSMRYWINLTKDFETHDLSSWGFNDFMTWIKKEGVKGVILHLFYYFRALVMLLSNVKFVKDFDSYMHLKERYYIKKISKIHNIPPSVLLKINELKRIPVGVSIFGVLSSFYVEGFLIAFSFIIFLIYAIIVASFIKIFFAFVLFLFASAMFFYIFSSDREIEPENKLITAAKDISKLINAKYYVFGHTHYPFVFKISKDKKYINSGSWLLRSPQNIPDKFSYNLSHIVISDDEATLRLWKPKYDKPIDFEENLKYFKKK